MLNPFALLPERARKPFVAAVLIVGSAPDLVAQTCDTLNGWVPGAVIMRSTKGSNVPGATLPGCVRLMNEEEMVVAPRLVDAQGTSDRYYGREALAYWYLCRPDTVYYLNSGRALRPYKWSFLRRIVTGNMELYELDIHGFALVPLAITHYEYYYLRHNGEWIDSKPIVWNEGGKRKRMERIFKDDPRVLERIAAIKDLDLPAALPELVRMHNTVVPGH